MFNGRDQVVSVFELREKKRLNKTTAQMKIRTTKPGGRHNPSLNRGKERAQITVKDNAGGSR